MCSCQCNWSCQCNSVLVLLAAGVWIARADEPPKSGPNGDDALVKRGEYLVREVAGCTHCHSSPGDKAPDITRSGLAGKWKEAELVKLLTTGKNPEGVAPTAPMPAFHLHDDDAKAVAAHLRSLPGAKGR